MPFRGVIFILVIILLCAIFFKDEIYTWLEDNVFSKDEDEKNEDKESEE